MAAKDDDLKRVEVKSAQELRAWLEANHSRKESIWLVTYKKPSPHHVSWSAVVDEVLCFGYIDSLPRLLSETKSMLRLSPRSEKSAWSKINKDKIERLLAEGRMHPAGIAAVEKAKENGTWSLLDEASKLLIPDDLRAALEAHSPALEHFEAFPKSIKRALLEWVISAKKPETRTKRVLEIATKAQHNERANQWKK